MSELNKEWAQRHKELTAPSIERDARTMHDLKELATRMFGEPCSTYDEGCPRCEGWKFVNELAELVIEYWELDPEVRDAMGN